MRTRDKSENKYIIRTTFDTKKGDTEDNTDTKINIAKYLSIIVLLLNATYKKLLLATIVFAAIAIAPFALFSDKLGKCSFAYAVTEFGTGHILLLYVFLVAYILSSGLSSKKTLISNTTIRTPIGKRSFITMIGIFNSLIVMIAWTAATLCTIICLIIFSQNPEHTASCAAIIGDTFESQFLSLIMPFDVLGGFLPIIFLPPAMGFGIAIAASKVLFVNIHNSSATNSSLLLMFWFCYCIILSGNQSFNGYILAIIFVFEVIIIAGGEKFGIFKNKEES